MTSINTNSLLWQPFRPCAPLAPRWKPPRSHLLGYSVGSAADNASYGRCDHHAFGQQGSFAVQDALGLGAAKTDTAYTGLNNAIDIVSEIKAKLVAAREPGVDKTKINKELTELKNQLDLDGPVCNVLG